MKIYIAEHAGLCFGVKRAIDIAEKTIAEAGGVNTYSLGPLVHNPYVVEKLNKNGLKIIDNIDSIKKGKIIIRSHGIPYNIQKSRRFEFGNN